MMFLQLIKKQISLLCLCLVFSFGANGQDILVPSLTSPEHPRLLTDGLKGKLALGKLIKDQLWARETFESVSLTIAPFVDRHQTDSTWIVSRLQLYWKSKYTDIYIKNGAYVRGSGSAPVPTVRFTGTRDAATQFMRPKLEDIKPYMDNEGKIYLQNKSGTNQWEWVDQSKSGRIIESINIEIMNKAKDAAMIYWYTGEEKYGKFAYDVLDTYLSGMYYRNEPIDLGNGHDQTLVGLSSFEVIHEDIVEPLTVCYDFLYGYIQKKHAAKISIYSVTMKKWADLIIKNGVPFNNWNLIEARFVSQIATVLEEDDQYADKKGRGFYLNEILNRDQTRQWSLRKILDVGYDSKTGIWSESPGYATGVLADFTGFVGFFDRTLKKDLLPQLPVIPRAVFSYAQYLYPNGSTVGFGDTHYGYLRLDPIEDLIRNAQLYGKKDQEDAYTKMLKTLRNYGKNTSAESIEAKTNFNSLFSNRPLVLSNKTRTGDPGEYLTPTFYAPNVGWVVQRNGLDKQHGLMISQAASIGNHAHANGIAMELYGKGLILAPESGIGGSYFQTDYAEYYSQFTSHNTVIVDGISSYPTMKSNHPLQLNAIYPQSGKSEGFFASATFSDVSFLEPETNSDQRRTMGILRTGDSTGYYVDIFRSKKNTGGDKYHDYIYHNIGQQFTLSTFDQKELKLLPTEKLTFAEGALMGYDYFYNKTSIVSGANFKGVFNLQIANKPSVQMNLWMKGYPDREIFKVTSPPSDSWREKAFLPDSIAKLPLPTLIVRQNGEAAKRPFVTIFEPSQQHQSSITKVEYFSGFSDSTSVGIKVLSAKGINDLIFSAANSDSSTKGDVHFKGSYAVVRESKSSIGFDFLFLGKGYSITKGDYAITAAEPAAAALVFDQQRLFFTTTAKVNLSIPGDFSSATKLFITLKSSGEQIYGTREKVNGRQLVIFQMPITDYTELILPKK